MTIIIPSKKIYKKENQKVLDNIIERVEVNATKITPKNEYDVVVYGESHYDGWSNGLEKSDISVGTYSSGGSNFTRVASYYSIIPTHTKTYNITLPKIYNNKYIDKLYEDTSKIVNIVSNKTYSTNASANIYKTSGTTNWLIRNKSKGTTSTIDNSTDKISPSWKYVYGSQNTTASVTPQDTTISVSEDSDNYYINIKVLCGYEEYKLGGSATDAVADSSGINVSGTYTKYETKKVDINFNGNTLGIDLAEETILIGNETSKKVFSVDNNELLQTTNINTSNNKSTIENEYEQTLNDFIKGKETAIINCAISDYFDDNGKLIVSEKGYNVPYTDQVPKISYSNYITYSIVTAKIANPIDYDLIIKAQYGITIKIYAGSTSGTARESLLISTPTISSVDMIMPITIPIGSIVIPQVYGQDGIDKPMSIKNGVAKQFKVIGNSIEYDGSITQQLTIQEIKT